MAEQQNQNSVSKSSTQSTGLYDRAKETAGKVYDAVSERAADTIGEQKSSFSEGLNDISEGIRRTGDDLSGRTGDNPVTTAAAEYSGAAADIVANVSDYFQRKDPRDMLRDAEGLARRNPAVFIAAAFGLGVLAARFLKSAPRSLEQGAGRTFKSAAGATKSTRSGAGQTDTPLTRGN
jgi:hypothetical protein